MKTLGKICFWSLLLALGLLLGIPAVIYMAWTGDNTDTVANAMSGEAAL